MKNHICGFTKVWMSIVLVLCLFIFGCGGNGGGGKAGTFSGFLDLL